MTILYDQSVNYKLLWQVVFDHLGWIGKEALKDDPILQAEYNEKLFSIKNTILESSSTDLKNLTDQTFDSLYCDLGMDLHIEILANIEVNNDPNCYNWPPYIMDSTDDTVLDPNNPVHIATGGIAGTLIKALLKELIKGRFIPVLGDLGTIADGIALGGKFKKMLGGYYAELYGYITALLSSETNSSGQNEGL